MRNLPGHLRNLGDVNAKQFLKQVRGELSSTFGSAIASSLGVNYYQSTDSNGFFAANRSTLGDPIDVNLYLRGQWDKGGIKQWFALTTESQNNPFVIYDNARSQLGFLTASAQERRKQELGWGNGFLSFCKTDNNSSEAVVNSVFSTAENGDQVGDSCSNKDGKPGLIETPASVVHSFTQKAVTNSGLDQLMNSSDLDAAFGAIVSALMNKVLDSAEGGLHAASHGSNNEDSLISRMEQFASSTTAAADATLSQTLGEVGDLNAIISDTSSYQIVWDSISSITANTKDKVIEAVNVCVTRAAASQSPFLTAVKAAAEAKAAAGRSVLSGEIASLERQDVAAQGLLTTRQAAIKKVQDDLKGGNDAAYTADLQALKSTPPSSDAVAAIQRELKTTRAAVATPVDSLSVSGGTIVDRLELLRVNATKIKDNDCEL